MVSSCDLSTGLEKVNWQQYLGTLPEPLQQSASRLRFTSDQQLHVFAWLLLRKQLSVLGYQESELLQGLKRTSQNKPVLPGLDWKFNLSHSGKRVMCALTQGEIGADIEQVRSVDFKGLSRVMNDAQWAQISQHSTPMIKFFEYWTIKESVIKADGRGLSMNLKKMQITPQCVHYGDQLWFYQLMDIPEYCACIALERSFDPPQLTLRTVEELMQWSSL